MLMGLVAGTVVSTQKDEGLNGFKLLLVRIVNIEGEATSSYVLAADAIGAGADEMVIVVQGSSARFTDRTVDKPVDSAIVAIVDTIEVEGGKIYDKQKTAEAVAE